MPESPARPAALVAAVLLLAPAGFARAADPPATRPAAPATRPAAWHAAIGPYVPAPQDIFADDPSYDPALVYLDAARADLAAREDAFRFLITTRAFAHAIVGAGASQSHASRAFQALMRQPDARAAFADLFDRGGDVAKLYALCGLRELDPPAEFAARIGPSLKSEAAVSSLSGCLMRPDTVGNLARGIAAGGTGERLLHPHGRPATRPAR